MYETRIFLCYYNNFCSVFLQTSLAIGVKSNTSISSPKAFTFLFVVRERVNSLPPETKLSRVISHVLILLADFLIPLFKELEKL